MRHCLIFMLFLSMCFKLAAQRKSGLLIWDDQPAREWMTQAYPIGNGRLGAMLFGGIYTDCIQFNEQSLWTGDEQETGAYQAFGEVLIDFEEGQEELSSYRRMLDLATATHKVSYKLGSTKYFRKAFASHPDQVMAFLYQADKKGAYNVKIRLTDAHKGLVEASENTLTSSGKLENGLKYGAELRVKNIGGEVFSSMVDNEQVLVLENVDSFIIYLSATTNYSSDRSKNWIDGDPAYKNNEKLIFCDKMSFDDLFKRHVKDYKSLFDRFSIKLGSAKQNNLLTTKQRIIAYEQEEDLALETLLLQYGRYLLISSSRKGGLPANLQGLWNNSNEPIWRSDYHSNINVQMNYWPAEITNLSETHIPYLDFINNIREVKKENTQKKFPGVRGWTVKTENNIFGGESFSWNKAGSAWFAQALWEHYAYNQDKTYLKDFAYPILKEICEFWDDHLKQREDGTIVVPDGWSPEHGPVEDGVSHDQQIIYDLFTNYIEASDSLNIDRSYRDHIFSLKERLLKPKIGKWGQLQEWEIDRDDPDSKHRHVSHLFALHPGRQISITKSPELAEAARVSLVARGDESTGWSMAWKMNLWARLKEGNHAYKIMNNFITLVGGEGVDYNKGGGVYENLLCAHPPFQIDGNLGYVAGIGEMLVQSHEGFIDLLPALPAVWANKGEVKGIRARGDITIDMKWKNGQVIKYTLYSKNKKKVQVKINNKMKEVVTKQLFVVR